MARPKKAYHEKRDQRFNLRLTLAEIEHMRIQSQKAGLEPHDYARRRVLNHTVKVSPQQGTAALICELNRLALQIANATPNQNSVPQQWQTLTRQAEQVLALAASMYDSETS